MQGTFTWGTIILSGVALSSVLFLLPALKYVPQEMAALDDSLSRKFRMRVHEVDA